MTPMQYKLRFTIRLTARPEVFLCDFNCPVLKLRWEMSMPDCRDVAGKLCSLYPIFLFQTLVNQGSLVRCNTWEFSRNYYIAHTCYFTCICNQIQQSKYNTVHRIQLSFYSNTHNLKLLDILFRQSLWINAHTQSHHYHYLARPSNPDPDHTPLAPAPVLKNHYRFYPDSPLSLPTHNPQAVFQ